MTTNIEGLDKMTENMKLEIDQFSKVLGADSSLSGRFGQWQLKNLFDYHNGKPTQMGGAIKVLKNLNVKITIIGKLKEEHLKLLSKNKIRYQNFINQSQKQIYSHYVKSDILFYPSIYEGFGIPILEAQAVGRLVITSTFLYFFTN